MHQTTKRYIQWGIALLGLVLCACDSQGATTSAALTPTGGAVGVQSINSANWGGYVSLPGDLTGARASWTEPTLSGPPDTVAATWVGIGGWGTTYNEGIQVGVREWLKPDGTAEHRIWYETLPASTWTLTDLTVAANDAISASVMLVAGTTDQWQLALHDATSGVSFAQTVTHTSARVYADYIVEDPNASANNGPPYYPLTQFSPITFTGAQACYASGCVAIGGGPALRVTMVRDTTPIAQPGPLLNDTFTVQRGN